MNRMLLLTLCLCGTLQAEQDPDLVRLTARQAKLDKALDKVSPALVAVEDGNGAGSGVVVSADGVVLTASHVVSSRRSSRLRVIFPNGDTYRAELLGMNRSVDAAMLKITDRPRNGKPFPHVDLGESSKLKRGDWCFALGHPGGFQKNRPAPVRLGRVLSAGYRTVVSDCAIVLGDSGGPLFDLSGDLIGIHSMITEVIVENRHVAVDAFRRDGDRMENRERWGTLSAYNNDLVETSFVGMVLRWRNFTPEVARVVRNSPADEAGIRPGDLLLTIADQAFADPLALSTLLADIAEDQHVKLRVDRVGREKDLTMTTGHKPTDAELAQRKEDGGITVEDEEHYRELKNQLTSLRRVGPYEKRSTEELDRFLPVVSQAHGGVVEFRELGETLALGAVMSDDGYILTKASELDNVIDPECILSDGRRLKMQEVAVDRAFDLMLVKVDARDLQPVQWAATDALKSGRMLITTDSRGLPLLPGVVSVAARTLTTSSKGFLGVRMAMPPGSRYVSLAEVLSGGAAERNGLKKGDIVRAINGTRIRDTLQMSRIVGAVAPNQKISLEYERGDTVKTIDIVLTPQFVSPDRDVMLDRYRNKENLGKFASAHNSGFPEVLQHDTDLFPHQCGGPVFDISGKAVGLNIARAARITSYAIPARALLRVFEELKNKGEVPLLKKAS
ncbi:MAG: trypsin-like peptidase domain-containing protein [Fuerstiella sp.]|nr:trypsin-like peptidase domain-containing protein [Fuerstiella sp.]